MATRPLVAAFWAIQNCLLTPTFPAVVAADLLLLFLTSVKSKMTQNITACPGAPPLVSLRWMHVLGWRGKCRATTELESIVERVRFGSLVTPHLFTHALH